MEVEEDCEPVGEALADIVHANGGTTLVFVQHARSGYSSESKLCNTTSGISGASSNQ